MKSASLSAARMTPTPCLVAILILLFSPLSLVHADEWHFSNVERIVAIGDVHGAYDALVATLQEAEVINSDLEWRGGETHLVFTGDLLDRGAKSRAVMDLIMRLESESQRAGGRVHVLLGNHEVMNLIGDLRYVADGEYASYSDLDSPKERRRWYKHFRERQPKGLDSAVVKDEFDRKAPPGFFGHRQAFRHDGIYGEWLLDKPFMIVINDTLFVHGGAPPILAEHGLAGINKDLKEDLRRYVALRAILYSASLLNPVDRFKESPALLDVKIQGGQLPAGLVASATRAIDLSYSPLYGSDGPTWYRGTAVCSSLVEGDYLQAALQAADARRIVVGHTTTTTRRVQQRDDGRVVEIDTGMLRAAYSGSGNALIIEGDSLSVVNEHGRNDAVPVTHPIQVGHETLGINEAQLADLLANGSIVETVAEGLAWRLVQVSNDQHTVSAYFRELREADGANPELAAYKLDRMLQLGMVPTTVRRKIAGVPGTLQFVPAKSMTEWQRAIGGRGNGASCALSKQIDAMYVFDTLINNQERTPSSMLYSADDWLLVLVDHERSFGIDAGWPALPDDRTLIVGDTWRAVLRDLTDDVLRAELGEVLGDERLEALAGRRDTLSR